MSKGDEVPMSENERKGESVNSNKKKILMIVGWAMCVVMLLIGLYFVRLLSRMDVFTTPIIMVCVAVIVAITAIFAVLQRWTVSGIITKIMAVILSAVMVVGSIYVSNTNKAIDKMSGVVTQIDNVNVYVLSDSTYQSIDDLKDAGYGVLSSLDRDDTDKAVKMISDSIGVSISTSEYTDAETLINALYNHTVEAVILNSAFIPILEGVTGFEDVESRIRSVWSADIETEVKTTEDKQNDVPEETKNPYDEYQDYLYAGDDVFTIYISGIDVNGSPMVNRNSDVNILMTINTTTRQILMINTPRDYYVPLSISNGVKDKLTHAGCYGVQVSVDTLKMLYGVDIKDYIKLNFTGFVKIIDLLGGVDVYSEYDFTSVHGYHYDKGYNTLDGEQALWFARERHAFGSGDRQRGKNQMAVIQGIIKKFTSTDALLNYNEILNAVSDSMATSMSHDEITDLIKMQLSDMRGWDIVTYSVDGTGDNLPCYSLSSPNYVMIPTQSTVDKAKEYLRDIYAGQRIEQ
ncbi:MAG: LCP family protein [Butyrivibrio sp.]